MRKIGFIDRHLNNFHANLYVKLIRDGRFREEFDVTLAYGDEEQGGMDTAAWCREYGVGMAATIEQVVNECDNLIILSPDNPERHRDLCDLPLRSGKACYVDKTFAPSYTVANHLISLAREHSTPMFTTSALRFVPEIRGFVENVAADHPAKAAVTRGPGLVSNYAVHCVEPLVMLLGRGAKSLSYVGDGDFVLFTLAYDDGRIGAFNQYYASGDIDGKWYAHPFGASVLFEGGSTALEYTCDRMFEDLVDSICGFFLGGPSPAPLEDTLEIMAILEAAQLAVSQSGSTVDITKIRQGAAG